MADTSDIPAYITATALLIWAVRGLVGRLGVLWLTRRAQKERRWYWAKDGWLGSEYCTDPDIVARKKKPPVSQLATTSARSLTSDPKNG